MSWLCICNGKARVDDCPVHGSTPDQPKVTSEGCEMSDLTSRINSAIMVALQKRDMENDPDYMPLMRICDALIECASQLYSYKCTERYDSSKPCECGDCEAVARLEALVGGME